MFDRCPGADDIRTPTLKVKKCPECGQEVEIFSTDLQVQCPKCACIIYDDLESCVQWCKYAKECVGEEVYERLMEKASKSE